MQKFKFGFIGGGTASAISMLSIANDFIKSAGHDKFIDHVELVCIHDPAIPKLHVGESLSPYIHQILIDVFNYSFENKKEFNETLRKGTQFYWEKNSKNFFVPYESPYGLHVNSANFSDWVIENLIKQFKNVSEIKENIKSIEQNEQSVTLYGTENKYEDFTFIFDCKGFPSTQELNSNLYEKIDSQFVNGVLLYQDFKQYNEHFSSATLHDNGWMFGIPLQHRKAFGYCYNTNFLTKEQALQNFSKLVNVEKEKVKSLNWEQYYRKVAIDRRIVYTGNKLYFYEPHGGMPLHYYCLFAIEFIRTFKFCLNQKADLKMLSYT